jgi:hypothetical protein
MVGFFAMAAWKREEQQYVLTVDSVDLRAQSRYG